MSRNFYQTHFEKIIHFRNHYSNADKAKNIQEQFCISCKICKILYTKHSVYEDIKAEKCASFCYPESQTYPDQSEKKLSVKEK